MSASRYFQKYFSKERLEEIYFQEIRYKAAPGIDRINRRSFEARLAENIDIIYRKVRDGTYHFSQYRQKLLSRGEEKLPRVISIPTIRDKLTQKALSEVLGSVYGSEMPFLHGIVSQAVSVYRSGPFDGFMRLDVADFYPSIRHSLLLKQIRRRIRKKELLHLIHSAISQPTVSEPGCKSEEQTAVGVPQGLSISNILANVYMSSLDSRYSNSASCRYFRYVDDILVFCHSSDIRHMLEQVGNDCRALGLRLHTEDKNDSKASTGRTTERFTYLGYVFSSSGISVRKVSLSRIRESIINALTNYKYSKTRDTTVLKWNLDILVTGCIFDETKYGWLFFFSQIDDLGLLSSLDHFLKKQLRRFGLDPSKFKTKTFVRAYHEITKNVSKTKYIPDFDRYSVGQKRKLLSRIFHIDTGSKSDDDVEYEFKKRIYRRVKELEKDLARPS